MRRLLAVLAVAATLLTAGCTAAPAPDTTSSPDTGGVAAALRPFYGQRLVWTSCGSGLRCATATAPLDWSAPGGARIHLALAMRPATGTRRGTLFTDPGGPGASGVDFLRSDPAVADAAVGEHYDVVAWDPRGVGASSAVECYGTADLDRFLASDPDLPAGSAALAKAVDAEGKAFADACARRTGTLLGHISTADTVRDLDMLRAATGSTKLDYLGFSYGTLLGARYADAYPARVGRMVLDGAVDPAATPFDIELAQTKGFGTALGDYLRDCIPRTSCPFHGETVGRAYDRIAALIVALRHRPLTAEDGRPVTGAVLRTAIDYTLYDRNAWQYLTRAFTDLGRGDPAVTQLLADGYADRGAHGYTSNLLEAFDAIDCLDAPTEQDPAVLKREGAQLDAADPLRAADDANDLGDPVCRNWPVPATGRPGRVYATGAPPIVVLGTTGDPATPIAEARSLTAQLPHAVLLTLRGEGHTAYDQHVACITAPVDRFLLTGAVPEAATCG